MVKMFFQLMVFAFFASAVCGGCSFDGLGLGVSDDDDDPAATRLERELAAAKEMLSEGSYTLARNEYDRILRERDPNNNEAKYGWSAARLLEMIFEYSNSIADLAISIEGFVDIFMKSAPTAGAHPVLAKGAIGGFIDGIIHDLEPSLKKVNQYFDEVAVDKDFLFPIETLPVTLGAMPILDIGSEMDQADVIFFGGLLKFVYGAIVYLSTVNLDIDLMKAIPPILLMIEKDDITETAANAISFVAYIIDSNPGFLTIKPNSEQRLELARQLLGGGAEAIVLAIDTIVAETDDQSDDLSSVDFAAEPPMIVTNFDITNEFVYHSTYQDGRLYIANLGLLRTALERMADNILHDGPRLTWGDDIAPLISMWLVIFVDSGLVGVVNEYLVTQVDNSVADFLFGKTDEPAKDEDDMIDVLTTLLPNALEFDLGSFISSPDGYHKIPPPSIVVEGIEQDPSLVFEGRFLAEFECEARLVRTEFSIIPGLLCPTAVTGLTDVSHFPSPATTYFRDNSDHELILSNHNVKSIAPDGIASPLPYIPFGDASFNGLFWIDITQLSGDGEWDDQYSGFALADNYSINKLLAYISDEIIDLLEKNNIGNVVKD